jgi:phosphatidylglycerol lysyltransferase
VPGGAGIFVVVLITLLAHEGVPSGASGLIATLVMFRVVYYLVPLLAALGVWALSPFAARASAARLAATAKLTATV